MYQQRIICLSSYMFVRRMRTAVVCVTLLVLSNWKRIALLGPRQIVQRLGTTHGHKYCMRYRRLIVVVAMMAVSFLVVFSLLTLFSSSTPAEAKKGPLVTNKVRESRP